jgi:hypothetical protein
MDRTNSATHKLIAANLKRGRQSATHKSMWKSCSQIGGNKQGKSTNIKTGGSNKTAKPPQLKNTDRRRTQKTTNGPTETHGSSKHGACAEIRYSTKDTMYITTNGSGQTAKGRTPQRNIEYVTQWP